MKKILWCLIVILFVFLIFCFLYGKQYAPAAEITPQNAIEIAKEKLDTKSIETIVNFDNPEIKEVIFDDEPSIYYFDGKNDVCGKKLYKITFNTTLDGLLGPIVFYVDKASGVLIGTDFRE